MPRPPKIAFHGDVKVISFSAEADLVLTANPLIELIILKCLAQAQELYNVEVCHFFVSSTHVHLIVVVHDPDDLAQFMKVLKCESSHAINRLLGRSKRTIWCEGYDSPTVVDVDKAIEKIAYLYGNAAQDNLENSIDRYPGLTSWNYFLQGKTTYQTYVLPRSSFRELPREGRCEEIYRKEARRLTIGREKRAFRIAPNAWMEAFQIHTAEEVSRCNQEIVNQVRKREAAARERREKAKKSVIGAARLRKERIGTSYTPQRKGRRTYVLASEKTERAAYIKMVKNLIARGREVYKKWCSGDTKIPYPLGLYPPAIPKLAQPLPGMV